MKWYLKVMRNYFNFDGRARRKEYWMFFLFNLIFAYVTLFIGIYLFHSQWLYLIYCLGSIIPSIAAGVRRMHDLNKSGWYILIPIYSLVLLCSEGDRHENQYGFDPKSESPTFDFENEAAAQ